MATIVRYDPSTGWYTQVVGTGLSEAEACDELARLDDTEEARGFRQHEGQDLYAIWSSSNSVTPRDRRSPGHRKVELAEKRLFDVLYPAGEYLAYAGIFALGFLLAGVGIWAIASTSSGCDDVSPWLYLFSSVFVGLCVSEYFPALERLARPLAQRLKWLAVFPHRKQVEAEIAAHERERSEQFHVRWSREQERKRAMEAHIEELVAMVEADYRASEDRWLALKTRDFSKHPRIEEEEWEMIELSLSEGVDEAERMEVLAILKRWARAVRQAGVAHVEVERRLRQVEALRESLDT